MHATQAKVRVACQRCRARRIRCDGRTPSCANCEKAKVTCIDVDSRNADKIMPRATIIQAKLRIQWLEEAIKTNLPKFDLSKGPQVDLSFIDDSAIHNKSDGKDGTVHGPNVDSISAGNTSAILKRSYSEPNNVQESAFENEARVMADDLGRFSLNVDSREQHYLGSSSGLVFSYLTQATSPAEAADSIPAETRAKGRRKARMEQDYTRVYELLQSALPSKDDALHLIELYMSNVHPDHPVLHLPSLLSALDALYSCKDIGITSDVDDFGWPATLEPFIYNGAARADSRVAVTLPTAMFHLFMVFTIAASIHIGGLEAEFAAAPFHRVAKTLAPDVFGQTTITSLQAVYLMAVHALMTPIKGNVWTLSYIFMAHCIDLGLHRQQKSLNLTDAITRACIFRSVYSLDRCIATIQGRPLGIRDEGCDTPLFDLQNMHAELSLHNTSIPCISLLYGSQHYTLHKFKLDPIISEIKNLFYPLPERSNKTIWSLGDRSHQARLMNKLKTWYQQIPEIAAQMPLQDTERRRWQLRLEQLYHSAVTLLYQPSRVLRKPNKEALETCLHSAEKQVVCFDELYENDTLQFDWRTVRDIFACGAIMIYAHWKGIEQHDLTVETMTKLRLCTTLLAVGGFWWPSVKKGKANLERLIDLTLQRAKQYNSRTESNKRARVNLESPLQTHVSIPKSALPPDLQGMSDLRQASQAEQNPQSSTSNLLEGSTLLQWSTTDASQSEGRNPAEGTVMVPDEDYLQSLDFAEDSSSASIPPELDTFLTDYFFDYEAWDFLNFQPPNEFQNLYSES